MQTNLTGDPSPEYRRLVASQTPAMVWATDRELRLTYVHRGVPMVSDVHPERLVAATVYDVVLSRDPAEPMIARHLAALGGVRQSFRHVQRGRPFDIVIDPFRDQAGGIAGCIGAALEVEESFAGAVGPREGGDGCEMRLRSAAFLADATRLLLTPDIRTSLDAIAHLAVPYLADLCAIDLDHDGVSERLVVTGIVNGVEVPVPEMTRRARVQPEPWGARLIVPLVVGETVLGAMTLAASAPGHFSHAQRSVARALGRRMALALDNAHRYQQVRDEVAGRDEFLSIATHEIRGALTSMRLAVQGLLRGSLQAAAAQTALEVIQREDRRLGRFVDDLLDVARMRTGQLHFDLELVDLAPVVREVVSRLTTDIPFGGSPVSVAAEGNLVGWWDRGRLEQVVVNLLSNAIKYGDGQPIAVTAVNIGDVARITIADSGIGIRPDMLPRIFNPFQRGVDARTYGGLGLGLHIVRTIVEGFGGSIHVDSGLGAGSTFTVDLPIRKER